MLMKLLWYEFHHFADLLGIVFNMKDCIDTNLLAMSFFFFLVIIKGTRPDLVVIR